MNSTSDYYKGDQGRNYFAYQNRFAELGARLNAQKFAPYVKQQDQVLDFGCGGGWLLKELRCSRRIGVELNEAAHAACRSNGIEVHKYIADVKERDFDLIITHHCLEHVPYPIEALHQLSGLLKKNGIIVVVVPIDDWRNQRDYSGTDVDHHLHTWTPRLMANTLVEAHLKTLHCKILSHAWFPNWQKLYPILPEVVFDSLCVVWGIIRRRRQLMFVAKKFDQNIGCD